MCSFHPGFGCNNFNSGGNYDESDLQVGATLERRKRWPKAGQREHRGQLLYDLRCEFKAWLLCHRSEELQKTLRCIPLNFKLSKHSTEGRNVTVMRLRRSFKTSWDIFLDHAIHVPNTCSGVSGLFLIGLRRGYLRPTTTTFFSPQI